MSNKGKAHEVTFMQFSEKSAKRHKYIGSQSLLPMPMELPVSLAILGEPSYEWPIHRNLKQTNKNKLLLSFLCSVLVLKALAKLQGLLARRCTSTI